MKMEHNSLHTASIAIVKQRSVEDAWNKQVGFKDRQPRRQTFSFNLLKLIRSLQTSLALTSTDIINERSEVYQICLRP